MKEPTVGDVVFCPDGPFNTLGLVLEDDGLSKVTVLFCENGLPFIYWCKYEWLEVIDITQKFDSYFELRKLKL